MLKLAGSHADRYFLLETDWGNEGDPWKPYGSVYDRISGVLFQPIPFRLLDDLDTFFQPWTGSEQERIEIEREAASRL